MISFLRRLWTFVRPYRTRLIMGLICGILLALANGALYSIVKLVGNLLLTGSVKLSFDTEKTRLPFFIQPFAQSLTAHLPQINSSRGTLTLIVCFIPIVMFCRSLFNYLNIYLVSWASARAIADLRTKVFGHLQSLPLSFFNQSNTGDLISRVTNDTQSLRTIIGTSLASLVSDPITVIGLFVMLMFQQPLLTLFSIIVVPLCVIPISAYSRKVRRSAKAMQTHAADLSKLMHESFTANRIIKAYNLEDKMLGEFQQITRRFVNQVMRIVRANEIPGAIMEFLGGVGVTLILLYIIPHREMMPTGDFLGFLAAIFLMYKPMKNLTRLHNQLHQAQAASERVFELLDTRTSMPEPVSPKPLRAANADVEFRNINFSYGEKQILRDINLTVKAGQLVAFVGSTGSGKTTLANLLPRFYDPQTGGVFIGGTDIREVSLKDLRNQIAVVTQDTVLFHDTIRGNIAVGRPSATPQEIEDAARSAKAHDFIAQRPETYDAIVGEKGVLISGGQKQRLSIARAILKNAPILILDEATNSLDPEVERAVQEELEKLMVGRTTICIAHRFSTVQKADVICVLNDGRIVETGTHAELIALGGVYKNMYEIQFQTKE